MVVVSHLFSFFAKKHYLFILVVFFLGGYFPTAPESANEYFSGQQPSQQQPGIGRTGRVTLTSGYLNIRNAPTTTAPIIGMAPNGATVNIIEQAEDWYRINYNGTDGYVSGQYIRVQ